MTGGLIKRVSPAMIHAYFEYITAEYPRDAGHGMLLVQLHGDSAGQPWAPDAARGMLRRAGTRAGLGKVKPHAFRHGFATAVLDASGGNLVIARDAGGWASARRSARPTPTPTCTTRRSTRRCAGSGASSGEGRPLLPLYRSGTAGRDGTGWSC